MRGVALADDLDLRERARDFTEVIRGELEPYAATVPGFFLYYPSRAQSSAPLRLFVETVKEVTAKTPKLDARRGRP